MEMVSWLLMLAGIHKEVRREFEDTTVVNRDRLVLDRSFGKVGDVPQTLNDISTTAILCLSRLVQQKISGEDRILGFELVRKMQLEACSAPVYLEAIDELGKSGWIKLISDDDSYLKIKPYCWLQARCELGKRFETMDGASNSAFNVVAVGFESNEEYLDAIINYINTLANDLKKNNRTLCSDDVHHLPEWVPDADFLAIQSRLAKSSAPIPAAEIHEHLKLSGWQYLFLMGMLGKSENAIEYDFADINDVVKLFASGYNLRRQMREHLAGKESQLVKHKLYECKDELFFTSAVITPKAMRLITGSKPSDPSFDELQTIVRSETLFDIDTPKVKKGSLLLPASVIEQVNIIIDAESSKGKKIRKVLRNTLPSSSGCPTGTTVLLYGFPGTGKTLTAHYLASQLKVPLLKIDCSKIIGSYVGESEKHVRRIFDDYNMLVKMMKMKPVLLLNEADQLLGGRKESRNWADQMNNNIQNLFLEGLEQFDGILVATTNMKELLDGAYNRRFTYKLDLPAPDRTLRRKLWESHLPARMVSSSVDLDQLAELDLTGGEIRLVLEQAVRSIAYQRKKELDGAMLLEIATREVIAAGRVSQHSTRFGFIQGE